MTETGETLMANARQNRIRRAANEVARELRSYTRIGIKFAGLSPTAKNYAEVERDLAQQKHQWETAVEALAHAQHGDAT